MLREIRSRKRPSKKKRRPEVQDAVKDAGNQLGLAAENRFLRGLGHAEFDDFLGWDLDFRARCRVAAHTSLAVNQDQFTNPREGKCVLGILISEFSERLENRDRLLLGDLRLLSKGGSDLGFREGFSHS